MTELAEILKIAKELQEDVGAIKDTLVDHGKLIGELQQEVGHLKRSLEAVHTGVLGIKADMRRMDGRKPSSIRRQRPQRLAAKGP